MLKIAVNAVSAKSGGAATYIHNLASGFAQVEHRHEYIFYVPAVQAKAMQVSGDNVTVLETHVGYRSSWRRLLWDQVALRRTIKKERADLLLSSSDFGVLFAPCQQILMIRNPLFFSSLYLERILPHKSRRFKLEFLVRRWLISLSARSSDVVITASQSMLDDVRRFIPIHDGKAVVNPFGVPLEKFKRINGVRVKGVWESWGLREGAWFRKPGKLRMLYVSEYSDYKNLTTLLKAVVLLREQGVDDFFLITTADPDQLPDVEITTRELDKVLASDPRIASYVRFIGSVPYERIQALYQESDLFVFPSLAESFGHPLGEAMASGLPIVASDIPICREICAEAAVYFNPLAPKDLAEKIILLRNPDLRQRLGELGRKRAETHFDWKDHVRRLVEIFEKAATNAQRKA